MRSPSSLDSYHPARKRIHAMVNGEQLSVFYKDIDGCFVASIQDNAQEAVRRPLPATPESADCYMAPSGHCQHFPQRGLRNPDRT